MSQEEMDWEAADESGADYADPDETAGEFFIAALSNKKEIVVGLDDGHGMKTDGKRTPIFPSGSGLKSETGNFMHENEFNRAVVKYAKEHLERCGIKVVLTAPGDSDVPLGTRTRTARDACCDVFVSVHANANTGIWSNARGIDTFYQRGAAQNSVKLAQILLKSLLKGTPMKDRGAKPENFQVLRETHQYMASCLVECGFMDNLEEAKLLLSDSYRKECAEEIARGICEFVGVAFVEEKKVGGISTGPKEQTVVEVDVQVDLRKLSTKGFNRGGSTYAPVRAVSIVAGVSVGYDKKSGRASINEVELQSTILIDGSSYALSREVANAIGRVATWNSATKTVKITKSE